MPPSDQTGIPGDVLPIFTPVMQNLRARGYGRSELDQRKVKLLSAKSALASGIAVRYKSDGQELERVGITYILHKTDDSWKFAVMVLHDAG